MSRLKVPPQVNQFTKTLDKNQSNGLIKLLAKYIPESHKEKRQRLLKEAEQKVKVDKSNKATKPLHIKFGLNHVTTLVENK